MAFLIGLAVVSLTGYRGALIGGWISHKLSYKQKADIVGYTIFSVLAAVALTILYPLFSDIGQSIINFVTIFWAQL